jgi:hypothetical protein
MSGEDFTNLLIFSFFEASGEDFTNLLIFSFFEASVKKIRPREDFVPEYLCI